MVHLAGVLAYGVYRAMAFHPFFRAGYRQWLETTPWTWGKPLPVGPAHPVWEDLVIVAAAGLPEWLSGDVNPVATYSVALGGYLAALAATFAKAGAWGFQFPVLFGLGLALRLWRRAPEVYGAAVLASYLIGMAGLRRSFRSWPWADLPAVAIDPNKPIDLAGQGAGTSAGRIDRLGPRPGTAPARHDKLSKLLWAAIVGWWCYAIEHLAPDQGGQFVFVRGMMFNAVLLLAWFRLMMTLSGYAPADQPGRPARPAQAADPQLRPGLRLADRRHLLRLGRPDLPGTGRAAGRRGRRGLRRAVDGGALAGGAGSPGLAAHGPAPGHPRDSGQFEQAGRVRPDGLTGQPELPGFHLMLQPRLGFWSAGTGRPARTASSAGAEVRAGDGDAVARPAAVHLAPVDERRSRSKT